MSRKRVVKMDIKYLEDVISAMRMINERDEQFAQKFAGISKAEAMGRWIDGLERSVQEKK